MSKKKKKKEKVADRQAYGLTERHVSEGPRVQNNEVNHGRQPLKNVDPERMAGVVPSKRLLSFSMQPLLKQLVSDGSRFEI